MGLQPDDAVHDVHAGLLQRPGLGDVGAFVETRLQLHECDHLLARLGGAHEGTDDRALLRGAVQRQLDRED